MKQLSWSEEFATGVELVDLQHRYFIETINRVATTLASTRDPKARARLLLELRKYAEFHFISEENLAESIVSPELQRHRERHGEILEEIDHRIVEVSEGGLAVEEFVAFLVEWFAGHTIYEDQKLFNHLQRQSEP